MADDPTLEYVTEMLGEEQTKKLVDELRQSSVDRDNFDFALMTRAEGAGPTMYPPPPPAGGPLPSSPSVPAPDAIPAAARATTQLPPQTTAPKIGRGPMGPTLIPPGWKEPSAAETQAVATTTPSPSRQPPLFGTDPRAR